MAFRANPPPPLNLGPNPLFVPPVAIEHPIIPPGTPLKLTHHDFNRWNYQLVEYTEHRQLMVKEMTGNFVGPMPARDFLTEFMRLNDFEPAPEVDFTNVPYDGLERKMYSELCDAINNSGVCPGFTLVDISNKADDNGLDLRPDWALCRGTRVEKKLDFGNMEFPGEAKIDKTSDAFFDTETECETLNPLEKVTGQSASTRGQIISYAATLHSFQHKCFSFSFLICGQYVRLFRWDRSGSIVTALFNFHEEPELLASFFWCYAHLTDKERGYDPTVKRATPEEIKYLSDATNKFIKDSLPRDVSFMLPKEDPAHPCPVFKIRMETDHGPHNLIVKKPFLDADSVCGRATRAYAAFDMKERRLVFFKDSWRTEDDDYASEATIYRELIERGVPFLPTVIAAGDVIDKTTGKPQVTFTQVWSHDETKPKWRLPCDGLRTLIHHRVIQELAYPLTSARSSEEAVRALRDAIEALRIAYHKADYLHRDVSTGNVMIDQNGRGILNDWDHAVKMSRSGNKHAYRTGTWQFISMALLREPGKEHDILDDLESCFWVLLYVSFIHFEITIGVPRFALFNEYNDEVNQAGQSNTLGGEGKSALLSHGELYKYSWKSPALTWLLRNLADVFQDLSHLRSKAHNPQKAEELKAMEGNLRTIDPILRLFDTALASGHWQDDRRAEPVERTTKKQEEQNLLRAKTGTFTTTDRKTPRFSVPLPQQTARSLSSAWSRGSSKRSADDVAAEDAEKPVEVRNPAKKARTEILLPKEPKGPPVREHRYQTRSKTKSQQSQLKSNKSNGSQRNMSGSKKVSQDVVMQEASHGYGTRSKTKPKATEPSRPPPLPKGSKGITKSTKTAKQPAPKQTEKRARTNKKQGDQNKRPPWK